MGISSVDKSVMEYQCFARSRTVGSLADMNSERVVLDN